MDVRDLQIAASGTKTFLESLTQEFKKAPDQFQFYFLDSPRKVYTGTNKLGKLIEQLKYFYWKQIQLPLKAKKLNCDIVFCSDFMVPLINLKFKTIPVFHDAFFWEYPEHYNKWWLKCFRTLAVNAAKKAYCMVTPTHYTQQQIAAYTGISTQQIIPIGEGPKSHSTKPIELNIEKPYLLHVGTLEKRKNLTTLIKAFKQIRENGHDINLILAGKASNKPSLDDSENIRFLIKSLQLENHITLTGYISDEQVAAYYQHAFAYVFPSINEGFGIPVLEAFYYKIPLLIANNSCLPEVAGDAAIAFDPHHVDDISQAISSLLQNDSLRQELIQKGTKQLQKYAWSKTAKQLLDIFAQAKG